MSEGAELVAPVPVLVELRMADRPNTAAGYLNPVHVVMVGAVGTSNAVLVLPNGRELVVNETVEQVHSVLTIGFYRSPAGVVDWLVVVP